MLVSDLNEVLQGVREESIETTLGEIRVDDDASRVTLGTAGQFPLDEQAERTLAKYLGVSKSYLAKCPPDLKAYNLNHWLTHKSGAAAVVETVADRLVAVHKPGLLVLPLREVANIITNTFEPDHEVVNLIRSETRFHIDIKTPHHIEVTPDERIPDRQRGEHAVGDITHGGVRILSNPTEVEAPQVLTYLHRLWCTNGSTSPEAEGTLRIRGNTVDEVLADLERAAREVMGDLDNKLAQYAATANRRPPGSPTRFAYQLGREYGLRQNVMNRIIDRVQILPEDASIYDVQQIFTQTANGAVSYSTMTQLQHISGDLAMNTDQVTHRCGTCERLLPE